VSVELARKGEGRILRVVIPLLLLHLTLISIQVEDPSGTLLLKRWVLQAGSPVLNGTASLTRGAGSIWKNYLWLVGVRAENARLQEDVRQLTLLNSSLVQAQAENARLRNLLDFRASEPYRTLGAHVVGRVPSFLSNTLYLDRGATDGLRPNQPVVSDGGVIGRTVLVTSGGCQVQLITNADASVGVMIASTRLPGVLKGTENQLLDLHYISNTEAVGVGDLIVTSGLDGIYPQGLPVGVVMESQEGKTGYRNIRVKPNADLLRIEQVLILLSAQKPESEIQDPGMGR
jgi:rod shape-determining protein MreC